MDTSNVKKLLINIPVKLCRNMSQNIITSIIKGLNFDISQHHLAILKLLSETGKSNITEVVDILSITKPQMTASTDKLVALDYITRVNDSNDRRKVFISLTEKGKEVVSTIDKQIDTMAEEAMDELTELELIKLEQGLMILEKLCINCQEKNHEKLI